MRIATFNINNIRKRLPNLLKWLDELAPDVVCLQELKETDAEFPPRRSEARDISRSGAVRKRGMVWPFYRGGRPSRP